MRRNSKLLFSDRELREVLENYEQRMYSEIDTFNGDQLLNTSVDELCNYFDQKYRLDDGIQLKEDEIKIDPPGEIQLNVSQGVPFHVRGISITFFIPFEGDRNLFKYRPSTCPLPLPYATISQSELELTYTGSGHNSASYRSELDRDLSKIRECLEQIARELSSFNASIQEKAKTRIEARREKILKDQSLVASLGFPLKRRENAPQTFVVPTVRRKVPIPRSSASLPPSAPEPTLDMREYEHILSVVTNMVAVMERSPKAFCKMTEEDLRQHFLVQLNGQYEGQATGETFNFEGKTDILIRVEGKNIFVAECKFWHGPESLKEAIDQLLIYATWRDTKTALLIFNRNKNFSSVLAKIPEVVKSHPNFRKELTFNSETGFRFVLHHRDDANRELILTVLAFEVPA